MNANRAIARAARERLFDDTLKALDDADEEDAVIAVLARGGVTDPLSPLTGAEQEIERANAARLADALRRLARKRDRVLVVLP
ncbi:MAG: hypothetical protein AAFR16_13455 [Pseudomonadota bacterium]